MNDDDRAQIIEVLNRYGDACDTRRWELFDGVFTPDAVMTFHGARGVAGRDAIVAMIQRHLSGCGATQHLLGNYWTVLDGDRARARCKVRAFHSGLGDRRDVTYEVLAEYRDELVRTPDGWRISLRDMDVAAQVGDPTVLGPTDPRVPSP